MDFTRSPEQHALAETTRRILRAYDSSVNPAHRNATTAQPPGHDPEVWRQLAELGAFSLTSADESGHAGPAEAGIVAQEIGRVLAGEPFVAHLLAIELLLALGGEEHEALIEQLTLGDLFLAVAADGRLNSVPWAHRADVLLVLAENGVTLHSAPKTGTPFRLPDGSWAADVVDVGHQTSAIGEHLGKAEQAHRIAVAEARARISACHEALGSLETCTRMTVDYLKTRRQFGTTLNKNQALQFRSSDMYVGLELTRSLVTWSGLVAGQGNVDSDIVDASYRALLQVATTGKQIAEEAVQLHGGIAMTYEYPIGHHLARITALRNWFGGSESAIANLSASTMRAPLYDPLN